MRRRAPTSLWSNPPGLIWTSFEAREETDLPLAAYQVSGEYAQIMAAAQNGWLDLKSCRDESLWRFAVGADSISTYFAKGFSRISGQSDGGTLNIE